MLGRDRPGQRWRSGPRSYRWHGADQRHVDLAAILGITKECPQRVHDLLERERLEAPGMVTYKADEVGGTERGEIDAVVAEAMHEKVACQRPVVRNRRDGQTSFMPEVLREAGHLDIGGGGHNRRPAHRPCPRRYLSNWRMAGGSWRRGVL